MRTRARAHFLIKALNLRGAELDNSLLAGKFQIAISNIFTMFLKYINFNCVSNFVASTMLTHNIHTEFLFAKTTCLHCDLNSIRKYAVSFEVLIGMNFDEVISLKFISYAY